VTSDLPQGAVSSSDGDGGHATSADSAQVVMPGRVPWRSVGAGMVSVGTPLGISILHPLLGEVLAVVELVTILTVLGTALFGSQTLSERAFRLLRWLGNRPEPPGPRDQKDSRGPRATRAPPRVTTGKYPGGAPNKKL
jgi:hypothetical protein